MFISAFEANSQCTCRFPKWHIFFKLWPTIMILIIISKSILIFWFFLFNRETDFFTNNIPNSGFSPQSTQSVFFHNPKTTKLERPQFSFSWNSALDPDGSSKDSSKKKRRKKKKNRRKKKKRIKDRPRFDDGSKRRRKKKKNNKHGGRSREEVDPTLPGMDHNIPPNARARFSAVANR